MKQRIYGISGAFVLLTVAGCSAIPPKTVTTNETGNGNAVAVVGTTNADQTNEAITTNNAVTNATTNIAITNENSPATTEGEEIEVDTSDWLTYTNEEYGFSFRYPEEWGEITSHTVPLASETKGEKVMFEFTKDASVAIQGRNTAVIELKTIDYELNAATDGDNIPLNQINFDKSEEELAQILKRHETKNLSVKKLTVDNIQGLALNEQVVGLDGGEYNLTYYIFPKYNSAQSLNFTLYSESSIANILRTVVNTLKFN